MRPKSVVLLYDKNGHLERCELFFSATKARRVFKKAKNADRYGTRRLYAEDRRSWMGCTDSVAKLVEFNEYYLGTKKDQWRRSFLNLGWEEVEELAARYDVPTRIIEIAAEAQRHCVERRRFLNHRYNAMTEAIMHMYLPTFVLRLIPKS